MEFRAWVGLSDSDGMYYERRVVVRLDEDDIKELLRQLNAAQQSVQADKPLVVRNSAGVVSCAVCGTGLDVE